MKEKELIRNTSDKISKREITNAKLAQNCAEEGIVLLKNDDILPINKKMAIALYGAGARRTVKGGLGSGEVNERKSNTIEDALKEAGYKITTNQWINDYDEIYIKAKNTWQEIYDQFKGEYSEESLIYTIPFTMPVGRLISKEDITKSKTDTAIYVISRISGEGADRQNIKGDYQLFDIERQNLEILAKEYKNVIVVINSGSVIDTSFVEEIHQIGAVIYMLQAGMRGADALVQIISGEVTPSGKLTDTIAKKYEDYPNSETFGNNDDNMAIEKYSEGIYVGYRYFDSFKIEPLYEFGYGLSYTEFNIEVKKVFIQDTKINCIIKVKNIGQKYSGKEVVQIYMSAPENKLKKEYQRLVAFAKTSNLAPGKSEELNIIFDITNMKSYSENVAEWILEKGIYTLKIGNSSKNNKVEAYIELKNDVIVEKDTNICKLEESLIEIEPPKTQDVKLEGIPKLQLDTAKIKTNIISYKPIKNQDLEAEELVEKLTTEELCSLVCGEYIEDTYKIIWRDPSIPGTAGETTLKLKEKYNIQNIILSDGPAGLRLKNKYELGDNIYYQYATAFPIATVLAQTWNTDLIEQMGMAVGEEMNEFGITIWLAPAMNIHRNPLCGRNFEYFSEDPLISGKMAASLTKGVQKNSGVGATIKHFVCNNQETNRVNANSVVSERTLREIYLRGFEIAIKEANPMAVMSSYNMVNGINPAGSVELCTKVLRNEWNFKGIVMTDWSIATLGNSTSEGCITAGNDLIMPGNLKNYMELKEAIDNKTLKLADLKKCATNILSIILKSNRYENSKSYYEYFEKQ